MKFGLFGVKCRFYAFKSAIADDDVTNVMREWNYARISAGIELTFSRISSIKNEP